MQETLGAVHRQCQIAILFRVERRFYLILSLFRYAVQANIKKTENPVSLFCTIPCDKQIIWLQLAMGRLVVLDLLLLFAND